MNLQTELDKTRAGVAQVAGWCMLVAMHQRLGIGAARLNRIASEAMTVEEEVAARIYAVGWTKAFAELRRRMADAGGPEEWHVPLNRAPKTRREQQLRMAGDEAGQCVWCCFALAGRKMYGWGPKRLAALHEELTANYRQFNAWEIEGNRDGAGLGLEWALEKLKCAVDRALREEVRIVDEDERTRVLLDTGDDLAQMAAKAQRRQLVAQMAENRSKALAVPVQSMQQQMQAANEILRQMQQGRCCR